MSELFKIDLFLFDGGNGAGGAAAAGGDGGAGGQDGVDAGASEVDAAPRSKQRVNPLANVRYGKQAEPVETEVPAEDEAQKRSKEWDEIRKGKFKAEYDRDVQQTIQARFKNQQDLQGKLDKLSPILTHMAKEYGLEDASDVDGLLKAFQDDDRLYEQEALEKGIPVDTVKELHRMREAQEAQQRMQAEAQQRAEFDAHMTKLLQQAEVTKGKFPGFDLMHELQTNEAFARLTSPSVGVDVDTAYYVTHRQQIEPMAMQVAVEQSERKLAAAQRKNASRPSEGAARGNRGAVEVKTDPRQLTRADMAEIRRRAEAGEKISF